MIIKHLKISADVPEVHILIFTVKITLNPFNISNVLFFQININRTIFILNISIKEWFGIGISAHFKIFINSL